MTLMTKRQIMTKTYLGKKNIKEVLATTIMGEILHPKEIWLVSAWISNFELLDNRGGAWDVLNPVWGHRMVTFFDLLETAVFNGCSLNLVVKKHCLNDASVKLLKKKLDHMSNFRCEESEDLHIKGLLTHNVFLSGSMNFTYSGANKNEEMMWLDRDRDVVANTALHFNETYFVQDGVKVEEVLEDYDNDFLF